MGMAASAAVCVTRFALSLCMMTGLSMVNAAAPALGISAAAPNSVGIHSDDGSCAGCHFGDQEHSSFCLCLGRCGSALSLRKEWEAVVYVDSYDRAGEYNVGVVDHIEGPCRHMDPFLAQLTALQRARSMALDVGQDTTFGWPMWWRSSGCVLLGPRPDHASWAVVMKSQSPWRFHQFGVLLVPWSISVRIRI